MNKTDYKQIVWIASYPKTGNTWARCFFDAYFIGDVDINELLTTISDAKTAAYNLDDSDMTSERMEIQHLVRPSALLRTVKTYLSTTQEIPLFVKTHNANLLINGYELIPETLTKAVIYITRDPRDVLPSFSKHMGVDMNKGLEWMQDKYRMLGGEGKIIDFLSSYKNHVNSYLNSDTHNMITIRYEDMLSDPIDSFSKMLKHAGVNPDRNQVIKALEIVKLDRMKKAELKHGFSEDSKHAKGQFFGTKHKQISPKQKHAIEKACFRLMKRLNYVDNFRKAS